MRNFGGGFIQRLGEAASHADATNLEKIKATWAEEWKKYEEMGRRLELN